MKALHTLLRIAKRDLEFLRRALGDQLAKRQSVDARLATQEQSLRSEQEFARKDYQATRAYGGFAALSVANRRALEAEGLAIDEESERLRALIAEAHVEMRKFERLLELQEERRRATLAKREDAELDELATQRAGAQKF